MHFAEDYFSEPSTVVITSAFVLDSLTQTSMSGKWGKERPNKFCKKGI